MNLHYNEHYGNYVRNLNEAIKDAQEITEMHPDLADRLLFNAGGYLNHDFFWMSLIPQSKFREPKLTSEFYKTLEKSYANLLHLQ